MTAYLLDTNILLRISDKNATEHLSAITATENLLARGDEVYITAQNVVEFWAVATRPIESNGLGWSTQRTATEIEQFLDRFPLLEESATILPNWLSLVKTYDIKGKKTHDTRLIAVMLTHGVTHLLTFNTADFSAYAAVTIAHPHLS